MSLKEQIPDSVTIAVKDAILGFMTRLTEAYDGLSQDDLVKIWNSDPNTAGLLDIKPEQPAPTPKRTKAASSKSTPKPPKAAPSKNAPKSPSVDATNATNASAPLPTTCAYILTKGARADQPCGLKSRKGGIFCSRHKAHENTCKPCSKSVPVVSRASPTKAKEVSQEFTNDALTFRKHDSLPDCYYHPPTGFVRKAESLYVDRKIVGDRMEPLTEEDSEMCKAHKLTICPDLLSVPVPTSPKPDTIQTLDTVENDVRSAIFNMNSDAIAIEAVLRELQVSPRSEK